MFFTFAVVSVLFTIQQEMIEAGASNLDMKLHLGNRVLSLSGINRQKKIEQRLTEVELAVQSFKFHVNKAWTVDTGLSVRQRPHFIKIQNLITSPS